MGWQNVAESLQMNKYTIKGNMERKRETFFFFLMNSKWLETVLQLHRAETTLRGGVAMFLSSCLNRDSCCSAFLRLSVLSGRWSSWQRTSVLSRSVYLGQGGLSSMTSYLFHYELISLWWLSCLFSLWWLFLTKLISSIIHCNHYSRVQIIVWGLF